MPTTNATETAKIARQFYEPLSTGDTSILEDILSSEWRGVPALRVAGPDGWKATVEYLRGVLSDLKVTVEDVIVDGDKVAVRGVARGIHSGELLGAPGTGREIEFRNCDIHRVLDGKIVESWHLEDYFGVASQLGLKFSL